MPEVRSAGVESRHRPVSVRSYVRFQRRATAGRIRSFDGRAERFRGLRNEITVAIIQSCGVTRFFDRIIKESLGADGLG